jgi:hypothetical protein
MHKLVTDLCEEMLLGRHHPISDFKSLGLMVFSEDYDEKQSWYVNEDVGIFGTVKTKLKVKGQEIPLTMAERRALNDAMHLALQNQKERDRISALRILEEGL